jgi:short-subunit dehydrogenase
VPVARVAVVTGASSGIGAAVARRLARDGWHCVLLSRREELLRAVADEIGGEFEVCDVRDRAAVERVAASVLERYERVSLLVNNAGIPGRGGFLALEPERIEAVVNTNYLGGVWCLRAFLPGLRAGTPSHVVNVVSVAGVVAFAPSGPYSASKHAQLAFSRASAAELRRERIHVHTILPGFVETEGFPQRTALRSRLFRRVVIGPERVADRIVAAIENDDAEVYVPGWYRVFAIAPALVARLSRRIGYVRR